MADVQKLLSSKGFTVTKSEGRRIVENFDKSPAAEPLWLFVSAHPSCRVIFNAIIKSGLVELGAVLPKAHDLLKKAKTSFVFRVNCKNEKCKNILELPNLADSEFKPPADKEITCPKCRTKNTVSPKDYSPNYEIEIKDLVKLLHLGCKQNVFSPAPIVECYRCCSVEPLYENSKLKFVCNKCKNFMHFSTNYLPTYDKEIKALSLDGQGYWLEWYVYRLLKAAKYDVEYGLKITNKHSEAFDADLSLSKYDSIIVIECKDGNDETFLTKLPLIKKTIEYYVLVTTSGLSERVEKTAKELLKKKLIIVTPEAIEKIPETIKNLKVSSIITV